MTKLTEKTPEEIKRLLDNPDEMEAVILAEIREKIAELEKEELLRQIEFLKNLPEDAPYAFMGRIARGEKGPK